MNKSDGLYGLCQIVSDHGTAGSKLLKRHLCLVEKLDIGAFFCIYQFIYKGGSVSRDASRQVLEGGRYVRKEGKGTRS